MESASATGEIELSIKSESETQAAAGWSRWYVVTVLGLVYAMNIAGVSGIPCTGRRLNIRPPWPERSDRRRERRTELLP